VEEGEAGGAAGAGVLTQRCSGARDGRERLEGTLVLERFAEIRRIEDFFDAIDSDDVQRAVAIMKRAIDASTIAIVVRKMGGGDGEH